jgi:hypothetical protein
MTDQHDSDHSVWSRPSEGGPSGAGSDGLIVVPPTRPAAPGGHGGPPPAGTVPIGRPSHTHGMVNPDVPGGGPARAGRGLTALLAPRQPVALGGVVPPPTRRTPRLGWFLAAGGVLVVVGLIVVLVLASTGTFGGNRALSLNRDTNAPPLAQACPPPTATSDPGYHEGPPPPPGPRNTDKAAGISYKTYGAPWQPWTQDWVAGQLGVHYRTGQGFQTEVYSGGTYWASILSGTVPATVNDGTTLDLKCVGQQIVADVRGSGGNSGYYPQPNTMDKIEDKLTTIGGLHAWVSVFRLHFHADGLKADNELVGVVTFDVGKTNAAVLYISIPGTHKQYDWVVNDVINSVRAA